MFHGNFTSLSQVAGLQPRLVTGLRVLKPSNPFFMFQAKLGCMACDKGMQPPAHLCAQLKARMWVYIASPKKVNPNAWSPFRLRLTFSIEDLMSCMMRPQTALATQTQPSLFLFYNLFFFSSAHKKRFVSSVSMEPISNYCLIKAPTASQSGDFDPKPDPDIFKFQFRTERNSMLLTFFRVISDRKAKLPAKQSELMNEHRTLFVLLSRAALARNVSNKPKPFFD